MIEIVECTVRDGSYVIDFQWSISEVENIVLELSKVGFKYIEIGHGLGLGASSSKSSSLCSDEEYTIAAANKKGNAKIGAFFIPGIGNKNDIKLFKQNGGDFIRIGTDASQSVMAIDFIEYAKSLKLEVSFNFMKSYTISPYQLCRQAIEIEKSGVDIITLVDSAGCMLPDEVKRYITSMKECLSVKIGFHGHNNLLLANANSLIAIQNGANMVDTTLMGMGRGAGNSQTESMVVILQKSGYSLNIDPLLVSKISEKYIASKISGLKGANGKELVLAYAMFHDSYLSYIDKYAELYGVDYQRLIVEVSKLNKQNPSEKLICTVAEQLAKNNKVDIFFPKFFHKEVI